MKSTLLFSFLLVMLSGCDQKSKNNSFRLEEKVLSFTTDFPAYNLNYFTDSNHTEFVSFADFVSAKKISFHSIDAKNKWFIDLKELMRAEKERFISYKVISPDSILLLSKYTNKLYLINRKAEIITKIDHSEWLTKGIEFSPPICFDNNSIYLAVNHYPVGELSSKKEENNWNAQSIKAEQICKVRTEKNGEQIIWSGKNLISRFLGKNDIDAQGTYYIVNKQQVYYFSPYSDTIYLIRKHAIKPLKKITSKLGKIHITPSTREQYNKNTDCINNAYIQQSFICEVLFDNKRNLIYIFVRKPKNGKHFPFNILVYDQNFKKLNELEFDGIKYYTSGFVGEKGLYLLRNYNKRPNQKLFDLLSYEK